MRHPTIQVWHLIETEAGEEVNLMFTFDYTPGESGGRDFPDFPANMEFLSAVDEGGADHEVDPMDIEQAKVKAFEAVDNDGPDDYRDWSME